MFQKTAKTATNAGNSPANVPKKCQKARADCDALAYETRVGSPPDFHLKRVPAPSCFRALNRSAQAGRRANAGNSPANVPKNHQNNNKRRRKNSGKCSKKQPKQQQMPEILPQMFHKLAKVIITLQLRKGNNARAFGWLGLCGARALSARYRACVESTPCFQP